MEIVAITSILHDGTAYVDGDIFEALDPVALRLIKNGKAELAEVRAIREKSVVATAKAQEEADVIIGKAQADADKAIAGIGTKATKATDKATAAKEPDEPGDK